MLFLCFGHVEMSKLGGKHKLQSAWLGLAVDPSVSLTQSTVGVRSGETCAHKWKCRVEEGLPQLETATFDG